MDTVADVVIPMVPDRPLDDKERAAMGPVIKRYLHLEAEFKRAEAELGRLCLLARDHEGQILNIDTLQWEHPADEDTEGSEGER